MTQSKLMGLVAGLFSNKVSSSSVYKVSDSNAVDRVNVQHKTGVDRYLDAHKGRSSVSGVSKYLKKQEQNPISGVSKYLIKQSVAERSKKRSVCGTGVERYLSVRKQTPIVVKTGVSKYLDNVKKTNVSSVSKYVVKKNIAERSKPVVKVTKVSHYLENKKEHSPSGVAKYLIKQKIFEKKAEVKLVGAVKIPTGVEKYLQRSS